VLDGKLRSLDWQTITLALTWPFLPIAVERPCLHARVLSVCNFHPRTPNRHTKRCHTVTKNAISVNRSPVSAQG